MSDAEKSDLSLQSGQILAHYRLIDKLGAGGMGQVYAAEDTRLKRQVALKVLPPDLADDPERRARFEREAQAVAALNHPNIVTVYSVEEVDGKPFLTMELVSGKTLSSELRSGGMPLTRLFELAIPLADAVGAAHDQGITHRDLKPDNVMVDDKGRLKVLDFGLAKLQEPSDSGLGATQMPTASVTQEGKILGTAAYMSPEQAEGKTIRPSSDVFSLGILLYEMATGERPFGGDTAISTISAILHKEPPAVHELSAHLPRHLGRIVSRCLTKDPMRRYATAWELRNELEALRDEVAASGAEGEAGAAPVRVTAPTRGKPLGALAATALVALLAGAAAGFWLRPGSTAAPRTAGHLRFTQVTFDPGIETFPSINPTGEFVLYTATPGDASNIFLQRLGGAKPIDLTDDIDADCQHPAYSPDGRFIAFRSDNQGGGIYVMGSTGESVRRLTSFGFNPAWSPDGSQIVFAEEETLDPLGRNFKSALWVVDVATGEEREIFAGDAVQPSWSPGGQRIAYWTYHPGRADAGQRDIRTVRVDGSDDTAVTHDVPVDWNPIWSADGKHLFFASDRDGSMNIWHVPIDEESGETRGEPDRMAVPATWSGPFAASASGRELVYSKVRDSSNIVRRQLDTDSGEAGPPESITRGTLLAIETAASPDGEWLAFRAAGPQEDIHIMRTDGSGQRKLTDDMAKDRGPIFMPDGKTLLFYSNRGGKYEIWSVGTDGSNLRPLTRMPGIDLYWPNVSPDGTQMVVFGPQGSYLFALGKELLGLEDAQPFPPFVVTGEDGSRREHSFVATSWSPDGTRLAGVTGAGLAYKAETTDDAREDWLVYTLETQTYESWKASTGLNHARWLPDGRHLVANAYRGVVLLDMQTGEERLLFALGPGDEVASVRMSPDGRYLYYGARTREANLWLASRE